MTTYKYITTYVAAGYTIAKNTDLYITSTGGVGGTGVTAAYLATIHNDGKVNGGVSFDAGGYFMNGSPSYTGALAEGRYGVITKAAATTVVNYGTVKGVDTGFRHRNSDGVSLGDGGVVTNGSSYDRIALVEGDTGIQVKTAAGTITNFGTVLAQGAASYIAIHMLAGGVVTNGAAADTVARIAGAAGVNIFGASGSVANYGTIIGQVNQGVVLGSGGNVTNGSVTDTAAAISGVHQGVGLAASGTVKNFGEISGSGAAYGDTGLELNNGGAVINGAATDKSASITGYTGVLLAGAGIVVNLGSISGLGAAAGDAGVYLKAGGALTNGSSVDSTATIAGYTAVLLSLAGSVTNFGVISGLGGKQEAGVYMKAGGVLTNAEDGAIGGYAGVVMGGVGTVENAGTISGAYAGVHLTAGGLVSNGHYNSGAVIEGDVGVFVDRVAGTVQNQGTILGIGYRSVGADLNFGGFLDNGYRMNTGALIQGNTALTLAGGATAINYGTISGVGYRSSGIFIEGGTIINGRRGDAGALIDGSTGVDGFSTAPDCTVTNYGTIEGAAGIALDFDASTDRLNVEAGSTFIGQVYGGGGTLDLASGTGTLTGLLSANGNVTVSGSMATTTFQGFGAVDIGAGAVFTDSGAVTLAAGQTISDAGTLTLGSSSKTKVTNAGLIETTGTGVLTLAGPVVNTGTIEANAGSIMIGAALSGAGVVAANGGTVVVSGGVNGSGTATINGGLLDFGSAFSQNVTFTGLSGELELARSQTYNATITGFSTTGSTSLDLVDIGFVSASEATFSGTASGGVLTVTDGTHTARINLKGDYTNSTFVCSSDGHNGVLIVDPRAKDGATVATMVSLHPLVAAMAALATPSGIGARAADIPPSREPLIARPNVMIA